MKRLLKNVVLTAGVLALGLQAEAQQTVVPENDPGFKLKFIGRTNLDAGSFLNKNNGDAIDNGVVINDTRLGFVGTKDKWEAKVELCFPGGGKEKNVSFRDVTMKYSFNEHNKLTFGHQFMPYGIKLTGINYKFVEDPSVDYTFCPSRKIGVNYLYTSDPFNLSTGIYSDGSVDNGNSIVNQGVNLALQLIWRPVYNETTVFHVGGAFLHTDSPNYPTFSGVVPVQFAASKNKTFVSTGEMHAPNYERYEVQALFIKDKFLFEAHFMGASVNRKDSVSSDAFNGFWAQTSYQIIGEGQKYNKVTALPTSSAAGTLEVLARFDHLNLDDYGVENDFEFGINYFINKHFNVRLNYVLAAFSDRPGQDNDSYHAIQTRLQFSF